MDTLDSLPIVWLPTTLADPGQCLPCARGYYANPATALLAYRPRRSNTTWLIPVCDTCVSTEAADAFERGADQITIHVPTARALEAVA